MTDQPLRYAVAGLGRAGWMIHVEQLRDRPDARIAGVLEPVADRRDEAVAEFGCRAYDSFEEMLADDGVDVVVIATPSIHHADECIRAMRAGRHVVIEKPMAMNLTEADAMIAAAKETRKELFINQSRRYRPMFTYFRQTISSGRIGELFHVRVFSAGTFIRRLDWQTLRSRGGGLLNNAGSHMLDISMQLVGSPIVKALGSMRHLASAGDAEDHVKALLVAADGKTIDLEISMCEALGDARLPVWTLCGTRGTLTSDESTATVRWFDPAEAPPIDAIDGAAPDRKYGTTDKLPWREVTEPAEGPSPESLYENVYNVLRRGGEKLVAPESIREMIRVMAMIREGTDFPA